MTYPPATVSNDQGNPVMEGKQRDPARINCERDQGSRAFVTFEPGLTVPVDRANEVLAGVAG